jgi:transposase
VRILNDKNAAYWMRHRAWLRIMVRDGLTPRDAAARCGVSSATAYRIVALPGVRRYLGSLYRWHADQALQARIDRELELGT